MAKRARLITGIILFLFLTCHLINLSFGLVSLEALDGSRRWFLWFWATGVGLTVLMGSIPEGATVVHTLEPGRRAWVQVTSGALELGNVRLRAGDGAAVSDENELRITATDASSLLVFDLP